MFKSRLGKGLLFVEEMRKHS